MLFALDLPFPRLMYSRDLGFLSMSCGTAIACSLALMVLCASAPMKNARSLFLEPTIALRIHFPVPNKNKNKF